MPFLNGKCDVLLVEYLPISDGVKPGFDGLNPDGAA